MIAILAWAPLAVCGITALARVPSALRGENRSLFGISLFATVAAALSYRIAEAFDAPQSVRLVRGPVGLGVFALVGTARVACILPATYRTIGRRLPAATRAGAMLLTVGFACLALASLPNARKGKKPIYSKDQRMAFTKSLDCERIMNV